ncbi:ATP-dependent Clp protease adapter ClpS [Luteolibacter pohnpeiensis]|uniref:ATP-dependent Clp protease adapter protein ClpS n=1 Tax=Luteolibacter pohnpeiensis TaxID=454153 RepID=A0A934SDD0_9BACT|nr:ATP-dependent Clp protease adapter ClpS [Luteolibacter pohnpeiensis]MBK1883173.1 ATP-dependent Clp protease adapter ClpS [Luteolibacter pohnpeiensis]
MSETELLTKPIEQTSVDTPWNVVVYDDPVNLMEYVTRVLMSIFGYHQTRATKLMMEVHEQGRSIVWNGDREKAEFYTQQLQSHQLKASMEKAE